MSGTTDFENYYKTINRFCSNDVDCFSEPYKQVLGSETAFLKNETTNNAVDSPHKFKPRGIINDPRNCSNIDPTIKNFITEKIPAVLLHHEYTSNTGSGFEGKITSKGISWKDWNPGGMAVT